LLVRPSKRSCDVKTADECVTVTYRGSRDEPPDAITGYRCDRLKRDSVPGKRRSHWAEAKAVLKHARESVFMPSTATMLPCLLTVEYHLPNETFPFHVKVTEMQVFHLFDHHKH